MDEDIAMAFINLKTNGKEVTPETLQENLPNPLSGDDVSLHYLFDFKASQNYGVGSTFTFNLPANMIVEQTEGSFSKSGLKEELFDYSYSYNNTTKEVTVTLDSQVDRGAEGKIFFDFNAKFGNFKSSDSLEQTLLIPIKGGDDISFPFVFKPTETGTALSKTAGTPERVNGEVFIPWTVWVNEGGEDLKDATLTDTPGVGHEVVPSPIVVTQYPVGLNGKSSSGTTITPTVTTPSITLPDGRYAYKIEYQTKVTREPGSSGTSSNGVTTENFTNSAKLTSTNLNPQPVTKTVTVNYGTKLDKVLKSEDKDKFKYQATWEVKFNYLGAAVEPDNAWIEDVLTTSGNTAQHHIDYDTFKVYEVTLEDDGQTEKSSTEIDKASSYSFEIKENTKFKIKFPADSNGKVTKAYKVVYETKLDAAHDHVREANAGNVINTVSSGTGASDFVDLPLTANIFSKNQSGVDFANKTITWTLTINAERALRDFTVDDTFITEEGNTLNHRLTPYDGSGELFHVINADELKYEFTNPDGGQSATGDLGYKLNFISDIPQGKTITIQYKTKFEINPNGTTAKSYKNKATANWIGTVQGKTYDAEVENKDYTPPATSPTRQNGYKFVVAPNDTSTIVNLPGNNNYMNHETQEITWRVGVNINKQDIDGATLTDVVGDGHELVQSSDLKSAFTVKLLDLSSSEYGTIVSDLDPSKWQVSGNKKNFMITFSGLTPAENNQAYVIEYKTKDSDNIIGKPDKSNYTNSATLVTPKSGTYPFIGEAKVKNANELLTKSGIAKPSEDTIEWTIDVNISLSDLGTDSIKLTDKPSANQKLLKNTFTKSKMIVDAFGNVTYGTAQTIAEEDVKDVVDTDGKVIGFELDLGKLQKEGYRIQYKTYFMGDGNTGETVSNSASINYEGTTSQGTSTSDNKSTSFKYSSSNSGASSTRGTLKLQKFKVNPVTGTRATFEGIKFELYNNARTIKLAEGTTDAEGFVTFEDVRYGTYTLVEATPTGYKPIGTNGEIKVMMGSTTDMKLTTGKPYTIENIEDIALGCTQFELTIKDVDAKPVANQQIKLVDANGQTKFTGTTDGSGKVTISNSVSPGLYTVVDATGNELGETTVKFGDGCQGLIQPAPACPLFTVTLNEINVAGDKVSRANVEVTVKDT